MKTKQNFKAISKVIQMVRIKKIDERTVLVNGKTVIKEISGKWVTNQLMTPAELHEFNIYIDQFKYYHNNNELETKI